VDKSAKPFVCSATGKWEPGADGNLDCKGMDCKREPTVNFFAVARCLGDVTYGGDNCGVSCDTGYAPDGEFAARVKKYCSVYNETCPEQFTEEFGLLDDGGEATCIFQAQQQTHGSGGEDDLDQDTITCRTQWLNKSDVANGTDRCAAGRLQLGTKTLARPGEKCVNKLCREGSIECLTCDSQGEWSASRLSCKAVKCKPTFDDIKIAACASRPAEEIDACELMFNLRGDKKSGLNCDTTSKYLETCPISCDRGYFPKQVPFLCEADQVGNGLWVGDIDCKPIQAELSIFTEEETNEIRLRGIDQNAILVGSTFDKDATPWIGDVNGYTNGSFLADTNNGKCPNGRFAQLSSSNASSDDCIPNATYHPNHPTMLHMRCPSGIIEDYEIVVGDPGWEVKNRKYPFQTADRFCRNDCGNYVHPTVVAVFVECGSTGEGDACNVTCTKDSTIKYEYTCDPFSRRWLVSGRFNTDGSRMTNISLADERKLTECEDVITADVDTGAGANANTEAKDADTGLPTGLMIVLILFPAIIVVVAVVLFLYFFGMLKCIGLSPNKSREAIYGEVYGDLYGPGGLAMADMSAYDGATAKKLEEFSGPRIKGRARASSIDEGAPPPIVSRSTKFA